MSGTLCMNAGEIAKAIDRIFSDEQLRNDIIQKGYERAREFDWQTTAYNTLEELLTIVRADQ